MTRREAGDVDVAIAPSTAAFLRRVSVAFAGAAFTGLVLVAALRPADLPMGGVVLLGVAAVVGALVLHAIDLPAALAGGPTRWVVDAYPVVLVVALTTIARSPQDEPLLWFAMAMVTVLAGLVARRATLGGIAVFVLLDAVARVALSGRSDWLAVAGLVVVIGLSAWFALRTRQLQRDTVASQLRLRATSERRARAVGLVADLAGELDLAVPGDGLAAIAAVAERLGWSRCVVHLDPATRDELGLQVDELPSMVLRAAPEPRGLVAEVVARGSTIVRDGFPVCPDLDARRGELGVVIGVPVWLGGDVAGAIAVGRAAPGHALTDVRLVELLAAQLGRALESARGFHLQQHTVREARAAAAARDDFVATVSHELRTPIQVLLGLGEVLDDRWDELDEDRRRQFVHRLRTNAVDLASLVDTLMDLSRVDHEPEPLRRPVDLGALAELVVRRVATNHPDHRVNGQLPRPGTVLVHGEPLRLDRVVENVVANACVHTPPGTTVDVLVERRGDEVVLLVRDDGPGIPADEVGRVTERFYRGGGHHLRRATRGLGLGLALADAIVAQHGGALAVDSAPGDGVAVTVTLPRLTRVAHTRDDGDPIAGRAGTGQRVTGDVTLLIDDTALSPDGDGGRR